MLQNTSKTLGFQKIMVYKTPPGGGGKPYLARGLNVILLLGLNCSRFTITVSLIIVVQLLAYLFFSFELHHVLNIYYHSFQVIFMFLFCCLTGDW